MDKNILMVATNYSGDICDRENCIKETGLNLEEYAVPYLIFEATNYNITTASLKGGYAPVDESSMSCSNPMEWDRCIKILRETKKISDIETDKFDAVYFVGGHGAMFDIAESDEIKNLVEYFYSANKVIAAISHGVAALINAKDKKGIPIVQNAVVTSFTNREEYILKSDNSVPFLLETKLRHLGADFVEDKPWAEHVETYCDNIITGQNHKSSTLIAEKIIEALDKSS